MFVTKKKCSQTLKNKIENEAKQDVKNCQRKQIVDLVSRNSSVYN